MKKFSSITRGNSRRTSRNRKLFKIAVIGIVLALLLFAVPTVMAFLASLVMSPINMAKTWFTESSSSLPQYLRDRKSLMDELNGYKEKEASQSGEKLTISLLLKENAELRNLLGVDGEKRLAAGIISRPNKVPYDVLVIDKGGEDGVLEGAPVFVGSSTVLGIVKKVFSKTSVVELITTPGFTVSVYIIGPNIYTNATGIGGGQLRVGVPQGITLTPGDLVVLPSIDSGVYGEISTVDSVPTRPEQYGYVSQNIPLSSLHYVAVGDTPLAPVSFEEAQKIVEETKSELFTVPIPEGVLVTTDTSSTTATTTATSSVSTTTTP